MIMVKIIQNMQLEGKYVAILSIGINLILWQNCDRQILGLIKANTSPIMKFQVIVI